MADNTQKQPKSMLEQFMSQGKVTVFESGLERPDHIQERPFFGLLAEGETTFIEKGNSYNSLFLSSAKDKDAALDTSAHQFFVDMEKRFRTVAPGITLFIIDPDAVKGRYLMDDAADRSLNKSLYMYIEDKLQAAEADQKKTVLTSDEHLKAVADASLTGRSPFSMAASVSPTFDALEGTSRVNLIVGDNPDSMSPNILDVVVGSNQRMEKEGITADEMRRLCLYHELGHATDEEYTGYSFDKISQNELSDVMRRHRTECIADAHATLQLARDFGNTKAAAFWSDMRMEYLRICVDNRLEDVKYENEFATKYNNAIKKVTSIQPGDPDYEVKYKELMRDKEVAALVGKMGSPLAYHTTDVVDQAIKYAEEHLKDGSLQKMTDLEVIQESKRLSETYGLSRQQVAEISVALAEGKSHPKYQEMMQRCEVSRDHMPMERAALEKEYDIRREFKAQKEIENFAESLGLPKPEPKFSPEAAKRKELAEKMMKVKGVMVPAVVGHFQESLFDIFDKVGFSREDMFNIISVKKEELRKSGLMTEGKDAYAEEKLKVLDAVIDQAPSVQSVLTSRKSVKDKLDGINSKTQVSGEKALVHFVKHQMRSLKCMQDLLAKAMLRSPENLTIEQQIECMRSERKDFNKALVSEKEVQLAAFALRSDKDLWPKLAQDKVLASMIDTKAKQKPAPWFALYQQMAGMPDKNTTDVLLKTVIYQHQSLAKRIVGTPDVAQVVEKTDGKLMSGMKNYVTTFEQDAVKPPVTTLSALVLKQSKLVDKR